MLKKIFRSAPEKLKNSLLTSSLSQTLLKTRLANFIGINTLKVEITKRCNLRCEMCKGVLKSRVLEDVREKKENINLSPADFRHILKKIPNMPHINFTGGGEPFLHPKFEKILKIAKKADKKVTITSNGTLLNKNRANHIVDLNIENITFSIDGATAETYEEIRKGADFEEVLQNIKRLIEIRKRKNSSSPRIRINFMGMRKNVEEFPKLVEIAGKLGISGVRFLNPIPLDEKIDEQHLHRYPKLFNKIRTRAKALARKYGLNLHLPPTKPRSQMCLAPILKVKIDAEGYVGPCGLFTGDINRKMYYMDESVVLSTDLLNMENVFQKDFDYAKTREKFDILYNKLQNRIKVENNKIWSTEHYQYLIKKQKNQKNPFDICKICPIRLGVSC